MLHFLCCSSIGGFKFERLGLCALGVSQHLTESKTLINSLQLWEQLDISTPDPNLSPISPTYIHLSHSGSSAGTFRDERTRYQNLEEHLDQNAQAAYKVTTVTTCNFHESLSKPYKHYKQKVSNSLQSPVQLRKPYIQPFKPQTLLNPNPITPSPKIFGRGTLLNSCPRPCTPEQEAAGNKTCTQYLGRYPAWGIGLQRP